MNRDLTKSLFGEDESQSSDEQAGLVVRVAFDSGADMEYDYILPEELGEITAGQRVEVPFGRKNKATKGFCVNVGVDRESDKGKKKFRLKTVKAVTDTEPLLNEKLLELAWWISNYYVCPMGQVLAAMVPAAVKKGAGVKKEKIVYLAEKETDEDALTSQKQKAIVSALKEAGAFDKDNAKVRTQLLEECDCGMSAVKTLSRKGVVKFAEREVLRSLPVIPGYTESEKKFTLNDDQVKVLGHINEKIRSGEFGVTLLYGVTDSGKTEVYIQAIEAVIAEGKAAIVLLPEIALTTQTINRFSGRFKRIAVMHSGLTAAQRNGQWQKIRNGKADVVIGARSAVFAPLKNLGLIVVDEEHEGSYKQDTAPRYNGRDVAIKRAQLAGAHCLLGSATPSLEMLSNCKGKMHFELVRLDKRVNDLPMPKMELVDMTSSFQGSGQTGVNLISPVLEKKLKSVLARGEQAILLLNRRGYSNFVFCPSCKHTLGCRNCDVTLTFHKRKGVSDAVTVSGRHLAGGYAICHYCMAKTLVPQKCPLCSKSMTMIGIGSQRLEEELAKKLPDARIARVDSDAMAGKAADYYKLLGDFAAGRIDILAGTQMLAKGLHFPNVTLVGVISADTALSLPDFRANERTFQLLSQVAGRAGRSEKGGEVIVQTFLTGQPAIEFAMKHDYEGFVAEEMGHRRKCNLPPCGRMAIVRMKDGNFDKLTAACKAMRELIDDVAAYKGLKLTVRGPMEAAINRIGGFHRMQIIVQAEDVRPIQELFAAVRTGASVRPAVTVGVDVDPINLM